MSSIKYDELKVKFKEYKAEMAAAVREKNANIQSQI
jgi:hypothetical protein